MRPRLRFEGETRSGDRLRQVSSVAVFTSVLVRSTGTLAAMATSTGLAAVPRAGVTLGSQSQTRPSRLKLVNRSHCDR